MPDPSPHVTPKPSPTTTLQRESPASGLVISEVRALAVERDSSPPAHASGDLDVTILMPCLDEVRTLPRCMSWAREALDILEREHGMSGEILIADNGSSDGSVQLAEGLGGRVVRCQVRGYGAALRAGTLAARGRYVVMGDADASYDFREAVPMIEKLERGYDLCMGSRFAGAILPGAMPWANRYLGNPVLTFVLNLFFRSGFSDAHCGLRAFTKEAFLRINPTSTGMEYASEMLIKAALLDCKRTEVPVILRPDGRDRPPHLKPLRDGWRHLRYLIMLCPAWLFLYPGVALMGVGATLFALLFDRLPDQVVRIGPVWFGSHWLPLAMAFTVCGYVSALFAMATTLVGIRGGYRRVTPTLAFLYRCSRLEVLLLVSLVCFTIGALIIGDVVLTWAGQDFGTLRMESRMIAGTTACTVGLVSFFSAFLLSVIAGNVSELEQAVTPAPRSAIDLARVNPIAADVE